MRSSLPSDQPFHLVIPTGTKVLTRSSGRVGVVTHTPASPDHTYRVRFPEGSEQTFTRADLTIFKHAQSEIPGAPDSSDLYRYVIYRCIVGSTAYGLSHEDSDVDRRGFYLPPADVHWALASVPEQLESEHEEVYWEIEKFIRLALKANPNVLECLYSPLVETCTPLARELIGIRHIFLSQHVHQTYNAYVLSQFKKLEQDLRSHGQIRWKHVMHLIRLLLSGVEVLRHGFVPLRVDEYRDRLLAIRRGEVPWLDVEQWRLALHHELDDALNATKLPEYPDYEQANSFLVHARRVASSPEYAP
ncbi:MAG TPA: nucleotidyltransferase domain-containing protein [Bryobacteraceae bacterium]|nr:nucleotidyltransferase domain-containing protein [Bryobacteraceae bacterium]